MTYEIVAEDASIVLVGSFNPSIFHPEWFLKRNIISDEDSQGAEVAIIHKDVAQFKLPWVSIQVLLNRFQVRTNDIASYNRMMDLVISTFSILEHTPCKELGMNLTVNFKVNNTDTWHKVGDVLVPKNIWEKSLPERVGMLSLKVQSPREDSLEGKIVVGVEPFHELGVRFDVNSHVNLEESGNMNEILSEHWEKSIELARKIATTTIEEAVK